jgi:DNA (cytosine-5)-methyltransferase 1
MEKIKYSYHKTKQNSDNILINKQIQLHGIVEDIDIILNNANADIDIWDTNVKVEENGYYWNKKPIYHKGTNIGTTKKVIVELFCGCGGTSLGFEMAGYEVIMGIDIHQPSINTFKANHPNCSTILGDIKKISPEEVLKFLDNREIDVLIGGVPCQGFSLNNRKRHESDERNFLYKEYLRFVEVLKPKAVVLENVSGMKSTANGEFVKNIERELSAASNMIVKSKMLYAPDYGVPQEFDFNLIKKTHKPENYVNVRDAIGDLPSLLPKEGSIIYKTEPFSEYQKMMREGVKSLNNHVAPNHPKETIDKIKATTPGQPMYPKFKQRIRLAWDILSPTQVSGGIRPQFQFGHPEDSRGLSIRERCRLQSFPDRFIICGGIVQGRVQTGNAVPPLLAKAVGLALKEYL